MTPPWPDLISAMASRDLTGEAAFRMMPTDDVATGPATGRVQACAGGHALLVAYSWTHPTDGRQEGVLLAGSPDEDDAFVRATWVDGWHQKPGPMHLAGRLEAGTATLAAGYAETWGWQIDLSFSAGGLRIVMRNVIPEDAVARVPDGPAVGAGPYEVMDLRLV